jgi:SAM-dependent methyltransferase
MDPALTSSLPAEPENAARPMPGRIHGQWDSMAECWGLHGSPLRPGEDDVRLYQRVVDELAGCGGMQRAVILGVTPELYHLRWPADMELRAIDRSADMIGRVWPGREHEVVRGDWTEDHFPEGSVQLVLCDGGLHLLEYPVGQADLFRGVAAMLSRGGVAVFRLFLPPAVPVGPEEVLRKLRGGEVPDMNTLKLLLGHALTDSTREGVVLGRVWDCLHEGIGGDRDAFFGGLGWPAEEVAVIDFYRDSCARYHFSTLEEVRELMEDEFHVRGVVAAEHPMGQQCVHLQLERR